MDGACLPLHHGIGARAPDPAGSEGTVNGLQEPYATAAGRALLDNTDLSAREIAEKAMKIAGEICIYTNDRITIEELKG